MVRCVVFDFDGTLVDSNGIKRQGFFDVAGEFENGVEIMERTLAREDAGDRYRTCQLFAEAIGQEGLSAELAERYTRQCEEMIERAPEIKGAGAALEGLQALGLSLYINSATPQEPLREVVERRGMSTMFRDVLGSPLSKSDHLRAIMEAEGLTENEVLMVGDGEPDRAAALDIGCPFVGITNTGNAFEQTPSIVIEDLNDLLSHVETLKTGSGVPH